MPAADRMDAGRETTRSKPVIAYDDMHAQLGYLVAAGSAADARVINFMIAKGRGLVYACITAAQADRLRLVSRRLPDNGCMNKTVGVTIDYRMTTTGISAYERADTIAALARGDADADDFRRPGHIVPLIAAEGGVEERTGIAECALELAKRMGAAPVACACEVLNAEGRVASFAELQALAEAHGLAVVRFSELAGADLSGAELVAEGDEALQLPDLQFIQYCQSAYGLNRGVYNTIDVWLYNKGLTDIVARRMHLLRFLAQVARSAPDGKASFRFGGGLTHLLSGYWSRSRPVEAPQVGELVSMTR